MRLIRSRRGAGLGEPTRPRAPGYGLGVLALVILVVVGTVALNARSTPPPTVSEFAPRATRQITESDPSLGQAPEAAGERPPIQPPGERQRPVIETERVHRCIGNPPRQIEDPQSPPCVPYWEGNNGGATWKRGVTGTEIRIAVANYHRVQRESEIDAQTFERYINTYETFFNERFEFYGRRLELVSYTPARNAASEPEMQNDAVRVADQIGAFAATQYAEQDGRQQHFFDALAKREVIGVLTGPGGIARVSEKHLQSHAPYQWDYAPTQDQLFESYGRFLCRALAGKDAEHAGAPESLKRRKFGIIVDIGFGDTAAYDIKPLRSALAGCGQQLVETTWAQDLSATGPLLRLQDADVTSVMYTGQAGLLGTRIMPQAASQGYHPEWLVWTIGFQDLDEAGAVYPASARTHVLGTQAYNKVLRAADMPHLWAAREIDPSASETDESFERLYKSLLLLASGIQMAGPRLTPKTFEQGLLRTEFPNPGAGGAPYYQARVGFPGVHTMQLDFAMVWMSATERSPQSGLAPAFCYVDRGRRYGTGDQWPRDPRFFGGLCR